MLATTPPAPAERTRARTGTGRRTASGEHARRRRPPAGPTASRGSGRSPAGQGVYVHLLCPVSLGHEHEAGTARAAGLMALSFLMLFSELALIRWLGGHIFYLSYFSNFVLLGSFLGFGLGFLWASRSGRSIYPRLRHFLGALFAYVYVFDVPLDVDVRRRGVRVDHAVERPAGEVVLTLLFVSVAATMACIGETRPHVRRVHTPRRLQVGSHRQRARHRRLHGAGVPRGQPVVWGSSSPPSVATPCVTPWGRCCVRPASCCADPAGRRGPRHERERSGRPASSRGPATSGSCGRPTTASPRSTIPRRRQERLSTRHRRPRAPVPHRWQLYERVYERGG